VHGKTVNENFATLAALGKAQREVGEFQRFQQRGQQLVEINQKIFALRPMEEEGSGWTPQEKNGCGGPSGNYAGNKPAANPHLCRATQDRRDGLGSGRAGAASELDQAGATALTALLQFARRHPHT
jgi:hypothetical protein